MFDLVKIVIILSVAGFWIWKCINETFKGVLALRNASSENTQKVIDQIKSSVKEMYAYFVEDEPGKEG